MNNNVANDRILLSTTMEESKEHSAAIAVEAKQQAGQTNTQRRRMKHVTRRTLIYVILIALLIYAFFPTFWLLSTSFKSQGEAFFYPPTWWPHQFTLHSYQILFADQEGFVRYFANSLIVSLFTTLLTLLAATPGGYVLSRFKFRCVRAVLLVMLATQMFPYAVILISLYTLFRQLHMLNTYPALLLAFTTFSLPFSVWMIKVFCDALPPDLW